MSPKKLKHESEEDTFVDHLDVLRKHLVRSIVMLLVLATIAFIFKDFIFNTIIFSPRDASFITNHLLCVFSNNVLQTDALCINQNTFVLMNIELPGQFRAHMWVSFIAGLIVGFPYLIWELWRFIKPALNENEVKNTNGILFFTSILFGIGVLFGYFIIVPLTINFLSNYEVSSQLENFITLQSFMGMIINITLATGAVFELPMLVYFLSKIGIVTPRLMRKFRKHAIVVIFIISGIITPPDVFSQFLVSIPLFFLYELSISISTRVYKKQKQKGLAI